MMKMIKSIRIDSNNIGFGPMPLPTDEVEQHLTISNTGRVWLSRYAFGDGYRHVLQQREYSQMKRDDVEALIRCVNQFLKSENNEMFVTDVGSWTMTVKYEDGEKEIIKGSMIGDVVGDGVNITQFIRSHVDIKNLFVFGR